MLVSTVSSVNPGFADLSQLLSSTGSATVTSALFTPAVQSALQNASPTDLVQLSAQALQLQAVGGLFANTDSSSTEATPESLLFQALSSSLTQSTNAGSSGSGTTAASSSESSADATAALALQQAYGLFGNNSSSGPSVSFLG
ncbi:MAG TPA: hypothetical protein VHY84_28460 [Bryobacteraceae bacterium]|jgi:hypothetical protein|nr:hypothetical protein [Bryobacteraceae bacterium]